MGSKFTTGFVREQYDKNFSDIIEWLLYGLIDFDFLSESILKDICSEDASYPIEVGEMNYETVIVPDCKTIRLTTLRRLKNFKKAGGRVIFAGQIPNLVDGRESEYGLEFAKECEVIQYNRASIISALENERDIEIRDERGNLSSNIFYQMRIDKECRWLFLCHVNRKNNNVDVPDRFTIKIKGEFNPVVYNTITGDIENCAAKIENGKTIIFREMYLEDSTLLRLERGEIKEPFNDRYTVQSKLFELDEPFATKLSEDNVLLLDKAKYSFDDGKMMPERDILQIDNILREKAGYPPRDGLMKQPYAIVEEPGKSNRLTLRYEINSKINVEEAYLAIEDLDKVQISFNGERIENNGCGRLFHRL